ncbi:MAG: SDR family NAD(P)-dependent oxidoreductase [Pseudonocardiaceae bacterium]
MTGPLAGKVALVAGATRGAGRAIAVELARAGAMVYATGRSTRSSRSEYNRPETIEETAELIEAAGGQGVALRVDHLEADQVAALVQRIDADHGRLDVLVNDIWGGETWRDPDSLTLIDTGLSGSGADIARAITGFGLTPADLDRVVLTHFHEDHTGAAAEIGAWGEVTVLAHRRDAPIIRGEVPGPPPVLTDDERELLASIVGDGLPPAPPARVDSCRLRCMRPDAAGRLMTSSSITVEVKRCRRAALPYRHRPPGARLRSVRWPPVRLLAIPRSRTIADQWGSTSFHAG